MAAMSQTLSHTSVLRASADELWEACKHADKILCDLLPEYFAKSEFLQGHGEPGSVRLVTMGPAIQHVRCVKERMDKFDAATKTLGYTVLEGDARYSAFSAEIRFEARGNAVTEATWTATFVPVGDMGPPEHVRAVAQMVLETLERAVRSKKTFAYTQTLDASPDALWNAIKHADEILLRAMPEHFVSSTMVEGYGGPGTVRVVKFGPAVQFAEAMTERMDFIDPEGKKLGYTVLKGDPGYKHFAATIQFDAGPRDGTTSARWEATYVPEGDMGPPEHVRDVVVGVWAALAAAVKADPKRFA